MKLRFEVNQAEALRRGIKAPKPLVTIHVSISRLTPEQRQLIEDRLDGIDVVQLHYDPKTHKGQKTYYLDSSRAGVPRQEPVRIQAGLPTFQGLMDAIEANQAEVTGSKRHKQLAEAVDSWRQPRSKTLHSRSPQLKRPRTKRQSTELP